MDYDEALRYIYGFTDYEKQTGYSYSEETFDLRRPRALLALMDDPQLKFPSLLVAGTKGKGSTSAMIVSILRASGRRVGLYSQPHLHTFRERISIGGDLISPEQLG
jgi:dihydrofolate synthase / folylpolyglutamate synthase